MPRFTLIFLIARAFVAQAAEPWRDPSPHRTAFVQVEDGVSLEVLDWGGSGRPIVLLAGLGHTAHVFDHLAPGLAPFGRIYGITRRGFGSSSHPESRYAEERLADDVIAAIDSLRLTGVLLVGHSFAGQELTSAGIRISWHIAGLVYLDAAADNLKEITRNPELQAIKRQLTPPQPGPSDRRSFGALRSWWTRVYGVTLPEAELRSMYHLAPHGRVGAARAANGAWEAAMGGVTKPDYARIPIPMLALYAVPRSARDAPGWLQYNDEAQRHALDEAYAYGVAARERAFQAVRLAPYSRIVLLYGADHYMFLSHEREVVSALREFVLNLR